MRHNSVLQCTSENLLDEELKFKGFRAHQPWFDKQNPKAVSSLLPDPDGKSSWGQGVYEDIENLSRALQEFKERYNKE
jgi:hypothetical protein